MAEVSDPISIIGSLRMRKITRTRSDMRRWGLTVSRRFDERGRYSLSLNTGSCQRTFYRTTRREQVPS